MTKHTELELIRERFLGGNIDSDALQDDFFPFQITWFVDLRCNLACPYCFLPDRNSHLRRTANLRESDVLNILRRLKEVGVLRIDVLGGEPFLAKSTLLTLARYAFDFNIIYKSTSTNGLIYDEDIVNALAAMDDLGFSHILQVSVDAATPETYYKVRGANVFSRVIENVRRFVGAGLNIEMGMVLTKFNVREIAPFAKLAKSLGVEMVSFGGFMPLGRGKHVADWHLDYKDIVYAYETINSLEGVKVVLPQEVFDRTCSAGIERAAMAPNGDLYPCNMFLSMPESRLGNIFDERLNKYNNLWYMRMVSYRVPAECGQCDFPPICHGACKAVIYDHFGEFTPAEPLCYLWGRER